MPPVSLRFADEMISEKSNITPKRENAERAFGVFPVEIFMKKKSVES